MPNNTPPAVEKANATRPITITSIVLVSEECFAFCCGAYGSTEHYCYDIAKRILSSITEAFGYATFFEKIAEHEHTDKRSDRRKNKYAKNSNNNRENDFFCFAYGPKLIHLDFALFFGS